MLEKLKTMFSFAPMVEYVDYEDGLLAVRSSKALSFENTTVKFRTSFGTILAYVLVESYDENNQVYRLKPLQHQVVLDALEVDRRESPRLPKVLRAASPSFPGYSGTTEDISLEGARVVTTGPLEITHDIELKIDLDEQGMPSLDMYADVAWTARKFDGSYHSGLRFQGLTAETKRLITRYINVRLAMEKRLHTLESVDPADLA